MVDVGGYRGSQLTAFHARFPDAPGRLILPDLPHILPKKPVTALETMEHFFFIPQPIKGARACYFHYIQHDWYQEKVVEIMKHIREAMKSGYSKMIINEWIVPNKDAAIFVASGDLHMMCIGGGEERSEARHRDYIAQAGLKVTGIWDPKDGVSESVIEYVRSHTGLSNWKQLSQLTVQDTITPRGLDLI